MKTKFQKKKKKCPSLACKISYIFTIHNHNILSYVLQEAFSKKPEVLEQTYKLNNEIRLQRRTWTSSNTLADNLVVSFSVLARPNGKYHMNGKNFKIVRDVRDKTPSVLFTAAARNGFNLVFWELNEYPKLVSQLYPESFY